MADRPQRLEALSRLEQMARDNQETWDLSENDQAAIRRVLDDLARAEDELSEAEKAWRDGCQERLEMDQTHVTMQAQLSSALARAAEAERLLEDERRSGADLARVSDEHAEAANRVVVAAVADRTAALARVEALERTFGLDTTTPTHELLDALAGAAEHLLRDHDCDQHGWEGIERRARMARERATALRDAARSLLAGDPAAMGDDHG